MLLVVFILASFLFQATTEQLLCFDYLQFFHTHYLTLFMGANSTQIKLRLDLTSQHNWMSLQNQQSYSVSMASIVNPNVEINYMNNTIKGLESIEAFSIETTDKTKVQSSLYFYILDPLMSVKTGAEGVLALPFVFEDARHSFLHFIYDKIYINTLAFSLVKPDYKRRLCFGGVPKEATLNTTVSFCNVLNTSSNWDCTMTKVTYRNKTDVIEFNNAGNNNKVTFNAGEDFVYAPKEFLDLIVAYYKNPDFNLYCMVDEESSRRQLYCSNSHKLSFGFIYFEIGDFVYEMDMTNLWMCYDELCYLRIVQSLFSNDWVIGTGFFNSYNALFDYTKKRITFYSKGGVTGVTPVVSSSWLRQVITLVNNLVTLGGIVIVVLHKKGSLLR